MRSEDGRHFENVIGVVARDDETGEEFRVNVLDLPHPLTTGGVIWTNERKFEYRGEDSLGRSVFTEPGQSVLEVALAGFPSNGFGLFAY